MLNPDSNILKFIKDQFNNGQSLVIKDFSFAIFCVLEFSSVPCFKFMVRDLLDSDPSGLREILKSYPGGLSGFNRSVQTHRTKREYTSIIKFIKCEVVPIEAKHYGMIPKDYIDCFYQAFI